MRADEKKQIYLDRFPAIIGRRMAEQCDTKGFWMEVSLPRLIVMLGTWRLTNEGERFWFDMYHLYKLNETIEHQQILDIFHKHGIKP